MKARPVASRWYTGRVRTRYCLIGALITTAAPLPAQVVLRPTPSVGSLRRPFVPSVTLPGMTAPPLTRNADGSFVSDIDGKRRNFGFRPGSIHSVRGKGFGRRAPTSTILVKSDDGRYAATLIVTRWEDDLIVAQLPNDQAGFPSADKLDLIIMTGPGGGGPRVFNVKGGRFTAEEAEVPLVLTGNDRNALTTAGLRTRVWNVGREFLSFERDGAASVTRYIDYPKDRRTTPCPAGGSERVDVRRLERALRLRGDFRISRIAMTHPPKTDGRPVGRYADAWQTVDGGDVYAVDWGVWRFRQDASFDLAAPFRTWLGKFGKHGASERDWRDIYAACASEFTLNVFVTGPRGLRPR